MSVPFLPLVGLFALLGADAATVDHRPSPIEQDYVVSRPIHGACIAREPSFNSSTLPAVLDKLERPAPEEQITPSDSGDANSFEFAIGVLAREIGIL